MKKVEKGQFGYLAYKRKIELMKTLTLLGISLAIFMMGYLTTKTKANYLTVVAILGCLPASKVAVSFFMYCKAKSSKIEIKNGVDQLQIQGFYDLYFTTYDRNISIDHLIIFEGMILGLSTDPSFVEKEFEEHLKKQLAISGIKDVPCKIFTDLSKYLERLGQIGDKPMGNSEAIQKVLFAISL